MRGGMMIALAQVFLVLIAAVAAVVALFGAAFILQMAVHASVGALIRRTRARRAARPDTATPARAPGSGSHERAS